MRPARLFKCARYNVELSVEGLEGIGVTDVDPTRIASLDSVDHVKGLKAVGRALAAKRVDEHHFDGFV